MIMRALRFEPSITSIYSWELLKYRNTVPADMIVAITYVDRPPRTRYSAYRPGRGGEGEGGGEIPGDMCEETGRSLSNLISMITRDEPPLQ